MKNITLAVSVFLGTLSVSPVLHAGKATDEQISKDFKGIIAAVSEAQKNLVEINKHFEKKSKEEIEQSYNKVLGQAEELLNQLGDDSSLWQQIQTSIDNADSTLEKLNAKIAKETDFSKKTIYEKAVRELKAEKTKMQSSKTRIRTVRDNIKTQTLPSFKSSKEDLILFKEIDNIKAGNELLEKLVSSLEKVNKSFKNELAQLGDKPPEDHGSGS